jgi:Arc/MetJ-type ribon-helix-helix transcriptional regulator
MAQLTIELDAKWLDWIEARIGNDRYASQADVILGAFEAMEREEYEDDAMYASYGSGDIDDPEAIARGRAKIIELIEEGLNSGPAVPWDLETFLREERSRDSRRAAA